MCVALQLTKQRILKKQEAYFMSLKYKSKIKHWTYPTAFNKCCMLKYIYPLDIYFHGLRYAYIRGQLQRKVKKREPKYTKFSFLCFYKSSMIPSFLSHIYFRTGKIERWLYMKCSVIFLETQIVIYLSGRIRPWGIWFSKPH